MVASDRTLRPVALAVILALAAGPVSAECFICDTEVVLDKDRADCFRAHADSFIAAAREDPQQRATVTFKVCGDGRGLDVFPAIDAPQGGAQKLEFYLELGQIECLRNLVQAEEIAAPTVIDLGAGCG